MDLQKAQKIFHKFSLKPDFQEILQGDSKNFDYKNWNNVIQLIPQNIMKRKYIYVILKLNEQSIISMYIGKSKSVKQNRLKQHAKGLKEFHEKKKVLSGTFYERFYERLFNSESNNPICLLIFKWNKTRILKNILPFDLEVNLANGEAILISTFSFLLKGALINHEFITRSKWVAKEVDLKKVDKTEYLSIKGFDVSSLWNNWCEKWFLSSMLTPNNKIEIKYTHIPLFETGNSSNIVNTFKTRNGKTILIKHTEMIQRIIDATKIIKKSYDYYSKSNEKLNPIPNILFTDGLIYCVYALRIDIEKLPEYSSTQFNSDFIPIYIGKTEAIGRNGGYSANLKNVDSGKNSQYFARWGNDDARHFGGLSLRFFNIPNAYPSTNYESWIEIMFDVKEREKTIPKLRIPIYFQMKPWFPFNISFSDKLGFFTPEMETFLIALCRNLFPSILVNKHNR